MTTKLRLLVPLALVALVAGCSSGSEQGTTTTPAPAASAAPSGAPGDAPQGADGTSQPGGGGTSGKIAYVSDQLMQVQGDDMQTAVAWTSDTTITSEVAGTLADVVPGVCVVGIAAAPASGDLVGTPDAGTTATPTPDTTGSSTATRVAITEPVDGECTVAGAFGGFPSGESGGGTPGERPSGMPTGQPDGGSGDQSGDGSGGQPGQMPSGMPTDLPSGMPSGGFGAGGFGLRSAGLVTAVDGSTITVQSTAQDGSTTTATIAVDAATVYTKTVAADSSAIVVGQCVVARGDADTSGKVTATTLVVSAPTDGQCASLGTGRGGNGLTRARDGGTGTDGLPGRTGRSGSTGTSAQTQGGTNA